MFYLKKKKKNWRMRIIAPVFSLSLLAGKCHSYKQMLLTESIKKYGTCVP